MEGWHWGRIGKEWFPVIWDKVCKKWTNQDTWEDHFNEIEEVVNMIASKKFVQRIIRKNNVLQNNDYDPVSLNSGDAEINRVLEYYRPLNVGSSMYNKQSLS